MELSLGVDRPVLIVAVLVIGAVLTAALASRPGSRFRVPGALLFLGIGMAVGDEGLGLIQVDDAALVRDIGVIALLVILFEGGLTTKPTDLRIAAIPGILLSTVGVVVTAAITGVGVWLLFDVDVITAALLGSVVASTDAAAVFSMMRTTPMPRRVSALLRIESGANDPIAVMLTVGLVAIADGAASGAGEWATFAAMQLGGGLVLGGVVGLTGVWVLRNVGLGVEGLYPVFAAAIGAAAYGVAANLGASGFVAVYVAGLAIGAFVPRHRRAVLGFHEVMANAAEVGLFLLLGLLVFPSRLLQVDVAVPALAVAGILVAVARPAAIAVCVTWFRVNRREQALLNWAGLRGAVPIVLATFPFTAGIDGGQTIFDVVFFVVLLSVLLQGSTLLPFVRLLGLERPVSAWSPVAEALPLAGGDVDVVELVVTGDLAIAGVRLRDTPPLPEAIVAAVLRGNHTLVPTGDTVLRHGDVLLLTSTRQGDAAARITAWARGESPGGTETAPR